jgi:glycosyltransferase involved in cell wall biosynthesis
LKKLIYILNHYSETSSSHFFHIIHLLEKMAEKGVKIALIIEKAEATPKIQSPGIRVFPIRSGPWKRMLRMILLLFRLNREGYHKVFIRINWRAALIAGAVRIATRQQIYFWYSTQGSRENYLAKTPGWEKIRLWLSSQLPMWLTFRSIHKLVTGPESMAAYFREFYGIHPRNIVILYNDINLERFHPVDPDEKQAIRQSLKLPADHLIVLFVHRFSPVRKNSYYFPYLLDTYFSMSPPEKIFFLLVGDGPEKESIEHKLSLKPYRRAVHFVASVPNAHIDRWYKAADLFIQPTWAEGFPRTMLEAMACGLPIVTTDAGGIADIPGEIQKEFMVKKTDRDAFAEKLTKMTLDPEIRATCKQENLAEIKRFETDRIAGMYIEKLWPEEK